MSVKNKKKLGIGWILLLIILPLFDLALLIRRLVHGKNVALFNPQGLIAREQHNLIAFTVVVLLVVAIPTLILLYFTAWKYRESNTKSTHAPDVRHSKYLVPIMWLIPSVVLVLLASVMWTSTHRLAPQNTIAAENKPITIQVVSLRWKWLFIYPEQKIATVNHVQVPVNTPVTFELTADEAPMSSFWIPNLGGQLYTMTGHVNRLNLIADAAGDFPGSTPEINGAGFAGMRFITRASSAEDFDRWVQEVRQSPNVLDTSEYDKILEPSENNPVALYSAFEEGLYDKVVMKYKGPSEGHMHHE